MSANLFNPLIHHVRSAALFGAYLLGGCAVTLPPPLPNDPANPRSAEAATAPLRPKLLASSRTFLSPGADGRGERTMQDEGRKDGAGRERHVSAGHEMKGMEHDQHAMPQMNPTTAVSPTGMPTPAVAGETYFTCPMHSQIQEAKPGQCPICAMTLVEKIFSAAGVKR